MVDYRLVSSVIKLFTVHSILNKHEGIWLKQGKWHCGRNKLKPKSKVCLDEKSNVLLIGDDMNTLGSVACIVLGMRGGRQRQTY